MRTTDDQKRAFGARLRAARKERFGTIQKMADHLAQLDVIPAPSVPKLSAWERGDYVPSEWWMVEHLEQVLGVHGELAAKLGGEPPADDELATLRARVASLEDRMAMLEAGREPVVLRAASSKVNRAPDVAVRSKARNRPSPEVGHD